MPQTPKNLRCLTRLKINGTDARPMEVAVSLKSGQTFELTIPALSLHISCVLLCPEGEADETAVEAGNAGHHLEAIIDGKDVVVATQNLVNGRTRSKKTVTPKVIQKKRRKSVPALP